MRLNLTKTNKYNIRSYHTHSNTKHVKVGPLNHHTFYSHKNIEHSVCE